MKYRYNYSSTGSQSFSLDFSSEDLPFVVADSHPKFDDIMYMYESNELDTATEEYVLSVLREDEGLDVVEAWKDDEDEIHTSVYSEGFTLNGSPIPPEVNRGLKSLLSSLDHDAEDHIEAVVNFLDRAETNPAGIATGDFLKWAVNNDIVLTKDGYVVGYKSLVKVDKDDYENTFGVGTAPNGDTPVHLTDVLPEGVDQVYRPHHHGGGITDGYSWDNYIPMYVGATVEMPRDEVDPAGNVMCSVGLHVGNYQYASGFNPGGVRDVSMTLVLVDPKDIISVPDQYFDKYRVCRYRMIAEGLPGELDTALYVGPTYTPVHEEEPEAVAGFEGDETVQAFAESVSDSHDQPERSDRGKGIVARLIGHLSRAFGRN